jgi:hypothetical protein
MHEKAIENIVRIFSEFKETYAALPRRPSGPMEEEGVVFMQRGCMFDIRGDALVKYRELMDKWATPSWKAKWSDEHRRDKIQGAMAEAVNELDCGLTVFHRLANEFDEEPPTYTVFIPISGIDLRVLDLHIGQVEVFAMSRQIADELIAKTAEIVADKPPNVKDALVGIVSRTMNELVGVTCLRLKVRGDSTKARVDAERACLQVIDILQVIVGLFVSPDAEVRVDFRSFDAVGYRPIILLSDDGSISPVRARFGAMGACQITPYVLDRLNAYKFESIFEIVQLSDEARTETEMLILRALHWFADGDLQRNPENQLQSYVTCLDMFFASKDGESTRSIQEGIAHIMGTDAKARREIHDFVGEVYDYRSRASHTGEQFELPELTRKCRDLVISFILQMVQRRAEFPTKKAIKDWVLTQRLS